jgi:[acyl-carrier-protein] S-malonyltransferase
MATALSTELPAAGGPVAGLFPGQGSQTAGMREAVAEAAPALLSRCLELVGEDPFERVAESTRCAQPAIFCASVASWRRLQRAIAAGALDERWRPRVFAGHSLGELAALVAAEAIDADTGLELAARRGQLMADAGERDGGDGDGGGMVALLGASAAQCDLLAKAHGATLANDNAPGQLVLAGSPPRLRELAAAARELGLRAIVLDVAGAFHSQAMAAAVEPFRGALDRVEIRPPRVPVISCASGEQMVDVRAELAQAIVRPVRWRQTMLSLRRRGAGAFVDLGPGRVLAGLVKRNVPEARGFEAAELIGAAGGVGVAA